MVYDLFLVHDPQDITLKVSDMSDVSKGHPYPAKQKSNTDSQPVTEFVRLQCPYW